MKATPRHAKVTKAGQVDKEKKTAAQRKLESCPGIHQPTVSGKRMRPLTTYYKREEELVSGMDEAQMEALVKRIKREDSSAMLPRESAQELGYVDDVGIKPETG